MEDQIIESSKTPRNTAKQDYADRLFSALVSSLTKDLQRGLENFLVSNHIKRKEIFLKFLEDNGYSLDTADIWQLLSVGLSVSSVPRPGTRGSRQTAWQPFLRNSLMRCIETFFRIGGV